MGCAGEGGDDECDEGDDDDDDDDDYDDDDEVDGHEHRSCVGAVPDVSVGHCHVCGAEHQGENGKRQRKKFGYLLCVLLVVINLLRSAMSCRYEEQKDQFPLFK